MHMETYTVERELKHNQGNESHTFKTIETQELYIIIRLVRD